MDTTFRSKRAFSRVRTGCLTCRRRHVKCDEAKPRCRRCLAANVHCEGYQMARNVFSRAGSRQYHCSGAITADNPTSIPNRTDLIRSDQALTLVSISPGPTLIPYNLECYHHFITIAVARLFRKDHMLFWRDQVAQWAWSLDFVHEAVLSLGAVHRSYMLLSCHGAASKAHEAKRLRDLGNQCYSKALPSIAKHLVNIKNEKLSAMLVAVVLLIYFEVRLSQRTDASIASLGLYY